LRDGLVEDILGDVYDESEQLVSKLKRTGTIDDEERQRLLGLVADGYSDVSKMLEDDQAR
jgi:hypothetical protein